MRYRRISYEYTVTRHGSWQQSRQESVFVAPARWRPAADIFESQETIEVTVDLAGVSEDDLELVLFENALVVQGQRRPWAFEEEGVFHAAEIRYGPFRLEVSLSAPVDHQRVSASHERGLLRVSLPKRGASV